MAMKRCPVCGERYSDTYKECPFCEEEAAFQEGEKPRRRSGGRHVAGQQKINYITPTLVVLILIMAGLLIYLLWGDKIAEKFSGEDAPSVDQVIPPVPPSEPPGQEGPAVAPGVMPDVPEDHEPGETQPNETGPGNLKPDETKPDKPVENEVSGDKNDYESISKLPDGLALSTTDFTLKNLGETHTITVSGGSGTYTWVSEDDGIASVDHSGKVTAVSGGTVHILVSDGSKKGDCIVRISASGSLPASPSGGSTASGGVHTLNREDMTLKAGEQFQLKLSGTAATLKWSSSNSGVASVSGNGNVTAVATGTATVTVSWDGGSLSCIVRVK